MSSASFQDRKISGQKSIVFLYTCNEKFENEFKKNSIYSRIGKNKIGKILIKYVQDLFPETTKYCFKTLQRI